jgi:hypothetical protein
LNGAHSAPASSAAAALVPRVPTPPRMDPKLDTDAPSLTSAMVD